MTPDTPVRAQNGFPGEKPLRPMERYHYHCDLRLWRIMAGFRTQSDFAEAVKAAGLKCSRGFVSLWESGREVPVLPNALVIVRVLEKHLGEPLPVGKVWSNPAIARLEEEAARG